MKAELSNKIKDSTVKLNTRCRTSKILYFWQGVPTGDLVTELVITIHFEHKNSPLVSIGKPKDQGLLTPTGRQISTIGAPMSTHDIRVKQVSNGDSNSLLSFNAIIDMTILKLLMANK